MFHISAPTSHPVGIRPQHANNLKHILRTSLLKLDADDPAETNHRLALESAKALLQQTSKEVERGRKRDGVSSALFRLMWKVGTELLRTRVPFRVNLAADDEEALLESVRLRHCASAHSHEEDETEKKEAAVRSARQLLKFLAQMSSVEPKLSPELLQEMTFYYIRFGMCEEAYNRLQGYISSYPYSEDASLVGYAGMLCYILWRQEGQRMRDDHEERDADSGGYYGSQYDSQNPWGNSQSLNSGYGWPSQQSSTFGSLNVDDSLSFQAEGDLASRHYSNALQYFEASLHLDYHNDMVLFHYVKLILAAGDVTTAKEKIERFIKENTSNPNGYRYLLQLHHTRLHGPSTEWIPIAYRLLEIDPVCDARLAIKPLVEYFEADYATSGNIQACQTIVNILGERLDHEQGTTWMWKTLAQNLRHLRQANCPFGDDLWIDRPNWWPSYHFDSHCEAMQNTEDVMPAVEEHVIAKAICALYLFPIPYAGFSWPHRFGLSLETLSSASKAMVAHHGIPIHLVFEATERPIPSALLQAAPLPATHEPILTTSSVPMDDVDDVCRMLGLDVPGDDTSDPADVQPPPPVFEEALTEALFVGDARMEGVTEAEAALQSDTSDPVDARSPPVVFEEALIDALFVGDAGTEGVTETEAALQSLPEARVTAIEPRDLAISEDASPLDEMQSSLDSTLPIDAVKHVSGEQLPMTEATPSRNQAEPPTAKDAEMDVDSASSVKIEAAQQAPSAFRQRAIGPRRPDPPISVDAPPSNDILSSLDSTLPVDASEQVSGSKPLTNEVTPPRKQAEPPHAKEQTPRKRRLFTSNEAPTSPELLITDRPPSQKHNSVLVDGASGLSSQSGVENPNPQSLASSPPLASQESPRSQDLLFTTAAHHFGPRQSSRSESADHDQRTPTQASVNKLGRDLTSAEQSGQHKAGAGISAQASVTSTSQTPTRPSVQRPSNPAAIATPTTPTPRNRAGTTPTGDAQIRIPKRKRSDDNDLTQSSQTKTDRPVGSATPKGPVKKRVKRAKGF
ncbi:hypothetical protein PhCBS80983_g02865 [Powellomyces hirtus]|uniref:Uncharacterized protein n=1 Tax=Powellomyces hirtus TaxID=109895 RepID=A0A507E730_9FUNG|nr:hypothetical protein PhCBS80983_g02865 [Powellomyces hirtus]